MSHLGLRPQRLLFLKERSRGVVGRMLWRVVVGKSSLVNWLSEATENWKPVLSKS